MESQSSSPKEGRFPTPFFGVVSALLVGTLLSFFVVLIRGVPAPRIQDEFAYLLAADTFANGRLTNPTHPKWEHFESFHIIHQPSYNAKYPPLQAMTLTIGQWLGHPIVGSCIASGISIAALTWMLFGWLPTRMHGVAWLVAVGQPSFHFFFAHSYMGGAVAITGASLLLGAFARLDRSFQRSLPLIAAIGIVLLANSRPFEGMVLTLSVAIGLVVRSFQQRWSQSAFWTKVIAPAAAVLLLGGIAMAGYNHQVTGSITKMPYQVHESTYGWNPVFLWQQAGEKPSYRHVEMDRFFTEDKEVTERAYASISATLICKGKAVFGLLVFYCGPLLLVGICGIFWFRHNGLNGYLPAFLMPVFLSATVSKWANFHYAAPAAPLLIALMLGGCWVVWQYLGKSKVRRVLFACAIAFHGIWAINVVSDTGKIHRGNWGAKREALADQLINEPEPDLVFVRYQDDHNVHQEWVYNGANIDQSEIIWAREINPTKRQQLLEYYQGRKVWILTVGKEGYQLLPFSSNIQTTAQVNDHETY